MTIADYLGTILPPMAVMFVVLDFVERQLLKRKLKESEQKASEAAEKLASLHNNSANEIKALRDKIGAHEISISKIHTNKR